MKELFCRAKQVERFVNQLPMAAVGRSRELFNATAAWSQVAQRLVF